MPGTLFVVATPIGNLEDITLRALRVLREATVIAAEDARRTARLLAHHGISTPMLSFHAHNTRSRLPQMLTRLERGEHIALVTDAGTPGVSDPGVELVAASVERGLPVDVVPGASAPLVAVVASGFPMEPLTIFGFPPTRSKARIAWIARVAELPNTFTFFEAPHRVRQTLDEAGVYFGQRPIMLARELTKLHQEFIRGVATSVLGQIPDPRGEFTVVVGPAIAPRPDPAAISDGDIADEFGRMTDDGPETRRSKVASLARKYGRSTRDVYALIEKAKKSGD